MPWPQAHCFTTRALRPRAEATGHSPQRKPDPWLAGPYLRLGRRHAASEQFDRAVAAVVKAIEVDASTWARCAPAANNLAWIFSEHGGDRDRALALAQTAKELAPENPQVSDTLERNVP